MQKDFFEQWTTFGKSGFGPMMEFNDIAARAFERSTKQCMGATSELLGLGVKQSQKFMGGVKNYDDAISAMSSFLAETSSCCMDHAQQSLDITLETSAAISKLMQKNANAATRATKGKASRDKEAA